MKLIYVKYNASWVRNENRESVEPTTVKIETTMPFYIVLWKVEPYDYQTTKMYLSDLKYLDDFLAGKN